MNDEAAQPELSEESSLPAGSYLRIVEQSSYLSVHGDIGSLFLSYQNETVISCVRGSNV